MDRGAELLSHRRRLGGHLPVFSLCDFRAEQKWPEIGSVEGPPPIADPQTWRLPADCAAHVAGPDLSRVCRTEPAAGAAAAP